MESFNEASVAITHIRQHCQDLDPNDPGVDEELRACLYEVAFLHGKLNSLLQVVQQQYQVALQRSWERTRFPR